MMYDELVKRLRNCISDTVEDCAGCPYQGGYKGTYCMNGLVTEAADAMEELTRNIRELPRWIPVTERLPDEKTPVQVVYLGYYDKKPRTDMFACLYDGRWSYWDGEPCSCNDCLVEITHWMKRTEPPKEET